MSRVLVDTAAWIDYFSGKKYAEIIDEMIDDNTICTNDLILTELLPSVIFHKQTALSELLRTIEKIPLVINWDNLVEIQIVNRKNGINRVGLPDCIILQNVLQNRLTLFSPDRHFGLMKNVWGLKVLPE